MKFPYLIAYISKNTDFGILKYREFRPRASASEMKGRSAQRIRVANDSFLAPVLPDDRDSDTRLDNIRYQSGNSYC